MILVTVGTHSQPFDRLIIAADKYAATSEEKIIIQKGCSTYKCKNAISFDFCSKEKMSELITQASVLVMQGGWGAMCEAIDKGKRVVAVPRIEGIEHIHDQKQVVVKLESLGCVIGVYDIKNLPSAIEKAKNYQFKKLIRGSAKILAETINKWFS